MDSSVISLEKLQKLNACFPSPDTWIRFRGRDGPRRCLVIAMMDCGISTKDPAYDIILEVTGAVSGRLGSGWNDATGRTFEDVKNAIHKAIKLVKEEENGTA